MSVVVASILFLGLAFLVVAFQLALVAGAPWGDLTWGGRFPGTLPGSMRMVALVSALLLGLFGAIVAVRAGLVAPAWADLSRSLVWAVVAYCALGVFANAVTPSKRERLLWLPVVFLMLVTSFLVAMS